MTEKEIFTLQKFVIHVASILERLKLLLIKSEFVCTILTATSSDVECINQSLYNCF